MLHIKKNNLFIAFLLCVITFNGICAMDDPQIWPSVAGEVYSELLDEEGHLPKWVTFAGGVLIGAVALHQFLLYIHSQKRSMEKDSFYALPEEIQQEILSVLAFSTMADTIEDTGKAINSLAHVNKKLNALINDNTFCKKIIGHLAVRFDCDGLTVIRALQTKEANKIELVTLCTALDYIINEIDLTADLKRLHKSKVDCNYIYSGSELERPYWVGADLSFRRVMNLNKNIKSATPLMLLCVPTRRIETDYIVPRVLNFVLSHKADINKPNNEGITPLMMVCSVPGILLDNWERDLYLSFDKIINMRGIHINQQDSLGNTAIMYLLDVKDKSSRVDWKKVMVLINKGANLELANSDGVTPLQRLQDLSDNSRFYYEAQACMRAAKDYKNSWRVWLFGFPQ